MTEPTPVAVELDIFSGRPNPSWILDQQDGAELNRRIAGLPASDREVQPPGLGYRGFLITGLPDTNTCRVYGGVIACTDASGEVRHDDTRHAEQWLLDQAKQRGWPVP